MAMAAMAVFLTLGLWGLLDLLIRWAAARWHRRRGRRTWWRIRREERPDGGGAAPRRPMTAAELARAAHLLAMGLEAAHSLQGALAYVAELEGAPEGLRARARRALGRLREGWEPVAALTEGVLRPDEGRLMRTLGLLWEAREETVRAVLGLFEAQMRRRAREAAEARAAILPFRAIVWILRAGILAGILAPLIPLVRQGWASLPGGWVLYGVLAAGGILMDRLIARAIRTLEEALQ